MIFRRTAASGEQVTQWPGAVVILRGWFFAIRVLAGKLRWRRSVSLLRYACWLAMTILMMRRTPHTKKCAQPFFGRWQGSTAMLLLGAPATVKDARRGVSSMLCRSETGATYTGSYCE